MERTIRSAEPGDAEAVTDLVRRAFGGYVERIGRPPWPMTLDYAAAIAEGVVWVSATDQVVSGVVVLQDAVDHLLIDVIAVDPTQQGEGVGAALMNFAERRAKERGRSEVRLYTNEKMTENLVFYPARGYREVDRRTEYGFTRVFFVKPL